MRHQWATAASTWGATVLLKARALCDEVGEPEEFLVLDDGFGPDGMILHGDRFYAAGSVGDRIAVISLDGELIEMIETGEGTDPTNLCAHDGRLWVTLGFAGALVSTPL